MSNCPKCNNEVSDTSGFCHSCGTNLRSNTANPVTQTTSTPTTNFSGNTMQQSNGFVPPKPDNNMIMCVICIVACCWPLGLVGLMKSMDVDKLYNQGNYAMAQQKADDAKKFAMFGIVGGVILIPLIFIFYILLIAASGGF